MLDGSFRKKIIGFVIIALEGKDAYYLHGGMTKELREYGGSAALFYSALTWAKHREVKCFNFMSSPLSQPALIRYKEKMGGITRSHQTYELPLSTFGFSLFKSSEWLVKKFNNLKIRGT